MSDDSDREDWTVRVGDYIVAQIGTEWHVLFQPHDLPHHYLSIARFQDRERAQNYTDVESDSINDGAWEQNLDTFRIKKIEGGQGNIVVSSVDWPEDERPEAAQPLTEVERAILAEMPRMHPSGATIKELVPTYGESSRRLKSSARELEARGLATFENDRLTLKEAPPEAAKPEPAAEEPKNAEPPAATAEPPKQVRQARGPYKTNADALHAAMLAMRDGENIVRASYSQLFKKSGVPEGSVEAALYSLTQKGILHRESPKGAPLVYRVLLDQSGNRLSAKPAQNIKKAPVYSAGYVDENIAGLNGSAGPELPKMHVDGLPGRLAIVGKYLIAGRHNIQAGGAEAAIASILIERWGNDTPGEEIIGRIAEVCKVKNGEARSAMGIMTESLNKKIECAGLVVQKNAEGWRLHVFDEARMVSEV